MKILIINNGTSNIHHLNNLLKNHVLDVVHFEDIDLNRINQYQSVILTGGHDFPVFGNEKLLEKEIHLIESSEKPIFGICFGFELIAHTFGSKLEILDDRKRGVTTINIDANDEIFNGRHNISVYESHRWVVKTVGKDLRVLATSKNGIEAVRHKSRPIYGVQFHPEIVASQKDKANILTNFLKFAEKYNSQFSA